MKNRLLLALSTLLLPLTPARAQESSLDAAERSLTGLAAIVGEDAIAYSELEKRVDAELRAQGDRLEPAARVQLRHRMRIAVLDYLIQRSLLIQEAKRQQLTVTEPEILFKINDQIERHRKDGLDLRDEEGLYTFLLESQNITREEYRDEVSKAILVEKLLWKEVYDRTEFISPRERLDFYRRNRELFQTPSELTFRQILLERTESSLDLIEIINRELDDGRDFAELASNFSQGLSDEGGLWVKRIDEIESWPGRVRDRLKSMKEGEVVRALESSKHFHYLKMESIEMGDTQPFEDLKVQQRIDTIIRKQRQDARRKAFVDRLRERYVVIDFLSPENAAQTVAVEKKDEPADASGDEKNPPEPGTIRDVSPDPAKPRPKPAPKDGADKRE